MKYFYITLADGSQHVSLPVRTPAPYYNLREVKEAAAEQLSREESCLVMPDNLRLVCEVRFNNKLEFDYFLATRKVEEK